MTVSEITRSHWIVRVFIKGQLCAFYVEAKSANEATTKGEEQAEMIGKLTGKAFSDYIVPGEHRRPKQFDFYKNETEQA